MTCKACIYVKHILFGTLIVLDEEGNVLLPVGNDPVPDAGNPHNTISQRCAQLRNQNNAVGATCCKILTWVQNKIFRMPGDHCDMALKGFPGELPTGG